MSKWAAAKSVARSPRRASIARRGVTLGSWAEHHDDECTSYQSGRPLGITFGTRRETRDALGRVETFYLSSTGRRSTPAMARVGGRNFEANAAMYSVGAATTMDQFVDSTGQPLGIGKPKSARY
jgi:hypothetical protein